MSRKCPRPLCLIQKWRPGLTNSRANASPRPRPPQLILHHHHPNFIKSDIIAADVVIRVLVGVLSQGTTGGVVIEMLVKVWETVTTVLML